MNTKDTNNNFDELLYSLPDYITGELKDTALISQIEAKIKSDDSFRKEYDSLTSTLNFMRETELEAPSEVYFANLQANILSKVHNEKKSESISENFLAKLVGYWKVLVPAVTVCIAIIVYSNMNTNELNVTKENKPVTTVTDEKGKVNAPETAGNNIIASTDTSVQTDNTQTDVTLKTTPNDAVDNNSSSSLSTLLNTEEQTEDSDNNLFFGSSNDELQTQDEYEDLTPEEQMEILNNLKNTL